jgi:hypothetical protein
MVDNLVNFNVYYVHDCQQVLENLDKKVLPTSIRNNQ